MALIEEISFGSYLTYTPRPESETAKESKNIMLILKRDAKIGTPPKLMSEVIAEKIKKNIEKLPFKNFFGPDVSLVPVPKSSLMKEGSLWVPERIAGALEKQNLGKKYSCLQRINAVNKASTSINSDRPKPKDHFESIKCKSKLPHPTNIILIDDVITSGSAILGCASKLKEVFPNASIKAFSVMRTISEENNFTKIEEPCIGTISLFDEKTIRRP